MNPTGTGRKVFRVTVDGKLETLARTNPAGNVRFKVVQKDGTKENRYLGLRELSTYYQNKYPNSDVKITIY